MNDALHRTRGPRRSEVLVQIVTQRPQDEMVELTEAFLADKNLGMRTTAGLNAQGAALKDVQVDRVEARAEIAE